MSRENPFKITENDILDVFNSILVNNDVTGNLQTQARLNFLSAASSSINSASNALNALQGYGPGIQSPSYIANYDHNADPSSKPFSNLHLNSVEEEDEFLYGDSNSVDEAQISSAKEDSFTINANRHNTGWSDEEDPYSESSGTVLSKLNSRLKKNLSDCDSQNKTFETAKFQHVKREDDLIEDKVPSAEISEQKYFSHQLEPDITILSPKTEINRFPVSETSNFDKAKSKYHVAAEILKKRIVEKTSSVNSSANEKLNTYPGFRTSKNFSELEYRSVPSDLKTGKPAIKNTINRKLLFNIRNHTMGPQRKRTRPSPYLRHRSPSYDYDKRHSKYSDSHLPTFKTSEFNEDMLNIESLHNLVNALQQTNGMEHFINFSLRYFEQGLKKKLKSLKNDDSLNSELIGNFVNALEALNNKEHYAPLNLNNIIEILKQKISPPTTYPTTTSQYITIFSKSGQVKLTITVKKVTTTLKVPMSESVSSDKKDNVEHDIHLKQSQIQRIADLLPTPTNLILERIVYLAIAAISFIVFVVLILILYSKIKKPVKETKDIEEVEDIFQQEMKETVELLQKIKRS